MTKCERWRITVGKGPLGREKVKLTEKLHPDQALSMINEAVVRPGSQSILNINH